MKLLRPDIAAHGPRDATAGAVRADLADAACRATARSRHRPRSRRRRSKGARGGDKACGNTSAGPHDGAQAHGDDKARAGAGRPANADFDDPNVDLVYGAYQRGHYKTAFDLATKRAQYDRDPKAMTMLGELYANGLGVKRDYAKAAEWYQRAADAGDREGMFALAMMRLSGRGGAVNRDEA